MYKVVEQFYDLTDNGRMYKVGDTYPQPNFSVTEKRLKELASDKNRLGRAVIVEVAEEKPKRTRQKKSD